MKLASHLTRLAKHISWLVAVVVCQFAMPRSVEAEAVAESGQQVSIRRIPLKSWIQQWKDDPQWIAGWPHQHIDSNTGRFLQWSPLSPPAIVGPQGQQLFSAWVAIGRLKNIDYFAGVTAEEYKHDSDVHRWVDTQLTVYRDIVVRTAKGARRLKPGEGFLFRESYEDAIALIQIIPFIYAPSGPYSGAERDAFTRDFVGPVSENLIANQVELNNKSLWRAVAINLACRAAGYEAACEFERGSDLSLIRQLTRGVSKDGYWIEQTPHYQDYVLAALLSWLKATQWMTSANSMPAIEHSTVRSAASALYCGLYALRYPNGELPNLNDVPGGRLYPSPEVSEMYARVVGAVHVVRDSTSEASCPASMHDSSDNIKKFQGMGVMRFRSGDFTSTLKYVQYEKFHVHQDILGIELMLGKSWVFRNPGVGSYAGPLYNSYYKAGPSHSVPIIDGLAVRNWFHPADIQKGNSGYSATVRRYQIGVDVSRAETYIENKYADELRYKVTDTNVHELGVLYHTPCTVALEEGVVGLGVLPEPRFDQSVAGVLMLGPAVANGNTIMLRLRCEGSVVNMQIFGEPGIELRLGRSPSPRGGSGGTSIFVRTVSNTGGKIRSVLSAIY